jgi:DNA processing protein
MVHRESLKNGFFSMAVVAHGADLAYPLQNESLAADLLENGCIWSEYPPGTLPEREFFPQRNRILAGMCQALVLVQSNRSGGAMITVRHALRYQRPLFAFAGAFTQPAYAGPLALISEGQAKALARPEQVLKALGLESKPVVRLELADAEVHFSENELPLVRELASEPGLFLDQLALRTQQSPAQVLALLSVMELEGKIEALPGNRYRIAGC